MEDDGGGDDDTATGLVAPGDAARVKPFIKASKSTSFFDEKLDDESIDQARRDGGFVWAIEAIWSATFPLSISGRPGTKRNGDAHPCLCCRSFGG